MTIFYSPSRRGFFDSDVHDAMPVDAKRITPARHRQLIAAQEQGAQIVPSDKGTPVINWPGNNAALRRAGTTAAIKRQARRRIEAISPPWRQLNDLRDPSAAGAARFAAIDAVRTASDLIERDLAQTASGALTDFPVSDHPHWPEEES